MFRHFCATFLILACAAPLSAALKDILVIDETKANSMADLKFNTREFQAREYNGLREFKTGAFNANKEFRTNRTFDPGGRSLGRPVAEVFTGTSTFNGEARMFSGTSAFSGKKAEVGGSEPFGRELNPMGERAFAGADKRYDGPELKRRTREIDIINDALKAKEGAEGRVLSMDEVREILNKSE